MGSEYNSNLISKLYQATGDKEIINTLEDMGDVGDPVFLHPILDGYIKHRDEFFGHYFLSTLAEIKSENVGKYLGDLLEKGKIKDRHITWVLNVMEEIGYFNPSINELAEKLVKNYSSPALKKSFGLDRWDLGFILEYLKKAGVIDKYNEDIRSLLFKENLNREEKTVALSYLLRIKSGEEFDYLIANYFDKINTDTELELIITKEILGWKGEKVEQLKCLIVKNGQEIAKEIIEKEREAKRQSQIKAEKKAQQEESIIYSNSKILKEIVDIRKEINRKTKLSKSFLYQLFPDYELLFAQTESANNEGSFVDSCSKLRAVVQNISKEVQNHGLNEETIKSLLPNAEWSDAGKSLNGLYLYLRSKNINTDPSLFGLKLLNKILSLVGHPDAEKELMEMLSKINALELYNKKEWSKLHRHLLEFYKGGLEGLSSALA